MTDIKKITRQNL